MTREALLDLFEYHYWARDRMFSALQGLTAEQFTRDLGSSFASVRDTAVHIYSADWIWFRRWRGESPTTFIPFDDYPDVDTLAGDWRLLEHEVRRFLDALDHESINRVYEYRLINGTPMRSVFWHMAQHVVNHGTYHRGQITTMLRQLGARAPESMDLIAFYRSARPVVDRPE